VEAGAPDDVPEGIAKRSVVIGLSAAKKSLQLMLLRFLELLLRRLWRKSLLHLLGEEVVLQKSPKAKIESLQF